MSFFSRQKVCCSLCGENLEIELRDKGPYVCSNECGKELDWRQTLSILGKEYYPDPKVKKEA